LRIRRDRLIGQCAAEQDDEIAPPHGAYPKARDNGVSIAGQTRASQQKAATYVRVGSNSVVRLGLGGGGILKTGVFVARPWMWTLDIGHLNRSPTHGYAATRDSAMAAFAKSWRRE
jgi:hypothetical protein